MSYRFVQSGVDLGLAKGPRLAVTWHMAEGGGTVSFLSKPNPLGVSVHFVIEYSGAIVQMLRLDHMQSSLRPTAIRRTDDPPYTYEGATITYGRTAALAVLGDWADTDHSLGPNHATIGVEIEGFAADGPNTAQRTAIASLAAYLGIPDHLGHRDFADYKACPGHKFPWASIGHASEAAMGDWYIKTAVPGVYTVTTAKGAGWIHPETGKVPGGLTQGEHIYVMAQVHIGWQWDMDGYLCSDATVHGRLVLAGDGTFTPAPTADCTTAVQLEYDRVVAGSKITFPPRV